MQYRIRPFRLDDLPALAALFGDAIRHLGASAYTLEQVEAWAGFADDRPAFTQWIDNAQISVAEDTCGRVIGFAGLNPPDRISALFVAPGAMRRGVASGLLRHLLGFVRTAGLAAVRTEASTFSRPLFERFGFELMAEERTELHGVGFSRYAMRLKLRGGAA